MTNPEETRRSVLMDARRKKLPRRMDQKDPRLGLCAQLIEEDLLDGWIMLDADGNLCHVLDARLASSGQEYLDQFEDADTPRHFIWETIPFYVRQLLKGFTAFVLLLAILYLTGKSPGNVAAVVAIEIPKPKEISITSGPSSAVAANVCRLCRPAPVE